MQLFKFLYLLLMGIGIALPVSFAVIGTTAQPFSLSVQIPETIQFQSVGDTNINLTDGGSTANKYTGTSSLELFENAAHSHNINFSIPANITLTNGSLNMAVVLTMTLPDGSTKVLGDGTNNYDVTTTNLNMGTSYTSGTISLGFASKLIASSYSAGTYSGDVILSAKINP